LTGLQQWIERQIERQIERWPPAGVHGMRTHEKSLPARQTFFMEAHAVHASGRPTH